MAGIPVLLKSTHPFPIPRGQTDTLSLKKCIRKQPLISYFVILILMFYLISYMYQPFIQYLLAPSGIDQKP